MLVQLAHWFILQTEYTACHPEMTTTYNDARQIRVHWKNNKRNEANCTNQVGTRTTGLRSQFPILRVKSSPLFPKTFTNMLSYVVMLWYVVVCCGMLRTATLYVRNFHDGMQACKHACGWMMDSVRISSTCGKVSGKHACSRHCCSTCFSRRYCVWPRNASSLMQPSRTA